MICKLADKRELISGVYDYAVECPEMASEAKAGQFLHILCGGTSYLRRPIGICDVIDDKYIRFVFEVRGEGTAQLAKANVGDMLDILGPLGNGFDTSIAGGDGSVLMIGGGIGVFPLLKLAADFKGRATAMLGYRNRESVILAGEFSRVCKNVFVATDDGSLGYHGFVTDVMQNVLRSNPVAAMYTCGPKPMMKIVADAAKEHNIPAQVSMEERMGCGIGACVTCTCTVGGSRKRVCKDGPVFMASEVEFDG